MNEQNTDVNSVFKEQVIRQMDRIHSITISTKEDPVLFTFLEDGGFMIEGKAFIDLMFRDPDKTRERLVSYMPDNVIDVDDAGISDREDGDGDDDE